MNLSDTFAHVRWIGGSACAGKSTIATTLADRHGLHLFNCDDGYERHKPLVTAEHQPTFHRVKDFDWNTTWMRPVAQQISDELQLYREQFPLLLADLAALPTNRPILAEGNALLPELLSSIGIPLDHAIWIVPTPAFQHDHYARRPWVKDVLAECADPETAWHNWMARDIGFAAEVTRQAQTLHRPLITVDGSVPIPAILAKVEAHLGF